MTDEHKSDPGEIEEPDESAPDTDDVESSGEGGANDDSDYGALTSGYDNDEASGYDNDASSAYTDDEPYTLDREGTSTVEEPEDTPKNDEEISLVGLEDAAETEATSQPADDEADDDEELALDLPESTEEPEEDGVEATEESAEMPIDELVDAPKVSRLEDEEPTTRIGAFFASTWLAIPLILLGIGLRLAWYWRDRAIWHDEGNLTVEILGRGFRELLDPLGTEQSAPIGFLLVVKSILALFGTHEYALRAFPLIASCAAIIFVYYLGRKITDKGSIALALTIFAVSLPLMRYGSELKQYSTDALVAAAITLMAVSILRQPFTRGAAILFALAGAIALWFSHPALFVLAGAGSALGLHAILSQDWKKAGGLILVAIAWIASFAADYFVSLQHYAANDTLQSWHVDSYFMIPPDRPWPAAIKWVIWMFVAMFERPMGLLLPGLGVVGFFMGIGALWQKRRAELFILILPLLVALGASYFGRYPFANRFLHFFAPALILIAATGLAFAARTLWTRSRAAAVILILWVVIQPAFIAANEIRKEPAQGARPVVAYLKENHQPDDQLYVFYWLRNEFKYYAEEHYDFDMSAAQVGVPSRRDWSWYTQEINGLAGNDRVWFAFIDNEDHLGQGERQYFETILNEKGEQLEKHIFAAYTLYLYDLSQTAPLETVSGEASDPVESDASSPENENIDPETSDDATQETIEPEQDP